MQPPQHHTTISRFVKPTFKPPFKSAFKSALILLTLTAVALLINGTYMPHTPTQRWLSRISHFIPRKCLWGGHTCINLENYRQIYLTNRPPLSLMPQQRASAHGWPSLIREHPPNNVPMSILRAGLVHGPLQFKLVASPRQSPAPSTGQDRAMTPKYTSWLQPANHLGQYSQLAPVLLQRTSFSAPIHPTTAPVDHGLTLAPQ